MAFVKDTLEGLLVKLGPLEFEREVRVVPSSYFGTPEGDASWTLPYNDETTELFELRTYVPWAHPYVRLGTYALGNALGHGHEYDHNTPIAVTHRGSKTGYLMTVTDQGPGFDYKTTLQFFFEDLASGFAQRRYAGGEEWAGGGFELFHDINAFNEPEDTKLPDWQVTFLGRGNKVAIYVPKPADD